MYLSGGVVEDPWTWASGRVNHLYEYSPHRNSWIRKADAPKKTAQGVTGVINGKLYVLPSAPSAHAGGTGGVIEGKFYVAGGRTWSGRATNRLDVYDPVTNTWSTLAPMPTARAGMAAAVLEGKLYVIGAKNVEPGELQNMVEASNPATNKWTARAPMPGVGRGDLVAGKIIHEGQAHILAVGGTDDEGSGAGDANQAYTP